MTVFPIYLGGLHAKYVLVRVVNGSRAMWSVVHSCNSYVNRCRNIDIDMERCLSGVDTSLGGVEQTLFELEANYAGRISTFEPSMSRRFVLFP